MADYKDLIMAGKQLVEECKVDRATIIRALLQEMNYQSSPEEVCSNCDHYDGNNCYLTELFPINVGPAGTCDHFKWDELRLKI